MFRSPNRFGESAACSSPLRTISCKLGTRSRVVRTLCGGSYRISRLPTKVALRKLLGKKMASKAALQRLEKKSAPKAAFEEVIEKEAATQGRLETLDTAEGGEGK